jgi:hypothetical protein
MMTEHEGERLKFDFVVNLKKCDSDKASHG